jgi:hypothetical protein
LKDGPLKFQCSKLEVSNLKLPKQLPKLELLRLQIPNIKLPKPSKVTISPLNIVGDP